MDVPSISHDMEWMLRWLRSRALLTRLQRQSAHLSHSAAVLEQRLVCLMETENKHENNPESSNEPAAEK